MDSALGVGVVESLTCRELILLSFHSMESDRSGSCLEADAVSGGRLVPFC